MDIKIDKCPYGERDLFPNTTLSLPDNEIVCLVGCNGIGKTTLLDYVEKHLENSGYVNKIKNWGSEIFDFWSKDNPDTSKNKGYIRFDKRTDKIDDESDYILKSLHAGFSSTGEGIMQRYGRILGVIGSTVIDPETKELVILVDDVDAGTSIDYILQVVRVFKTMKDDLTRNKIKYNIILTANSYELCRNFHCISVYDFKDYSFNTYEDYKNYVLESSEFKQK